jgi:integrative and conjugative element protein (TIGR02256 family)
MRLTDVVWLDVRARALIEHESRKRPHVETGGALFGFAEGDEVVVAGAYGPGPRAKHRRKTFEPHPATTATLMRAVREHSEARYRYLGSWHSHPAGPARPSSMDVATTEAVAIEAAVLLPRPVVLIQSLRGSTDGLATAELRAWRWTPEVAWLLPCDIEDLELPERLCPRVQVTTGRPRRSHLLSPDPE